MLWNADCCAGYGMSGCDEPQSRLVLALGTPLSSSLVISMRVWWYELSLSASTSSDSSGLKTNGMRRRSPCFEMRSMYLS